MGMLYLKFIKQLHKLCLLFILSLQFCIIESYYNDGRFSHHGIPLLSFDTHLQNSLNGAKASMFPLSSSENLLLGRIVKRNPIMAKMKNDLKSELTDLSSEDKSIETSEQSPVRLEKRRYNKAWFGKSKDPKRDVSNGKLRLPFEFYKALQNLRRKKSVNWRPRTIFHKKWGPMLSYEPRKLQGKRLSPFGLSHSNENVKRLSPFGLSHSNKNVNSKEEPEWSMTDTKSQFENKEKKLKGFSSSWARSVKKKKILSPLRL